MATLALLQLFGKFGSLGVRNMHRMPDAIKVFMSQIGRIGSQKLSNKLEATLLLAA